jgi:hypothetical protein
MHAQDNEDTLNLHIFDDKITTGTLITPRSWFTRLEVSFIQGKPKIKVRNFYQKNDLLFRHLFIAESQSSLQL